MKLSNLRFFRRRRRRSREERAEKYKRGNRPYGDIYRDLLPRIGLVLTFVVAALLLFPPSRRTQEVAFKEGEIADRNVIAPFEFEVPLSDEDLRIERAAASLNVLPIYDRQIDVERDLTRDLRAVLDSVAAISAVDTLAGEQKMDMAGQLLPFLSPAMLRDVTDPASFKVVRNAAIEYQAQLFARGFIDNSAPLRRGNYNEIAIKDGQAEKRLSVRDIIDQGRVDRVIKEEAFQRFQKDRNRAQAFFEIVRGHLLPNLILNSEETDRRREAAMAQVPKTVRVSKNQRIIGKHDKVTAEQMKMLQALEKARASLETRRSPAIVAALYAGEVMRLLLFGLLLGGYIYVLHRRVYHDLSELSAILTVLLLFMVFSAVVLRFQMNLNLVPVAFVSLMITALFDYRLGLVTTIFACFFVPLVSDVPATHSFVSLIAGTMGVVGLLRMRSRTHFYSVFMFVSIGYVIGVLATELGHLEKVKDLSPELGWSIVNGLFSSLSVMFLLPIFEAIFNLTTRFTLLELTDLNKPILKRLNMEAPGTYHHSMLLGSLVDAVASDIGADPLKARVMAYYHDIGKMFKPEYYAENQDTGFNKHEKITPQMSGLILLSHVKDGVELAREEKLPDLIIDAIQQHHGTTVMAFFYQKALETDSHSSVKKDDFRYPGPRPQSKEAAILMLADTVEPACRSLKDPTAAHLRNMVVKLINLRAQDGELDESGLTLNDLARTREKFISILTGVYHRRVAYPGQEKEEKREGEAIVKPA